MRKILKVMIAVVLVVSMTACTGNKNKENDNNENGITNNQNINNSSTNNKQEVNQNEETDKKTSIKDAKISSIKDQKYTGKAISPTLTVILGDKTLVKDKDYSISYTNNKNVGTVKVTITGIGDYEGSVTTTFKIVEEKKEDNKNTNNSTNNNSNKDNEPAKTITIKNDANQIRCYQDHEYTGKEIKPKITIKINGKTLKENVDYTVRYYDNIEPGIGKYEVTGIGNYEGTVKETFEILPKAVPCNRDSITLYTVTTYHIYKGMYVYNNDPLGEIALKEKMVELGLMKEGDNWSCGATEYYDEDTGELIRFMMPGDLSDKDWDFYIAKCGDYMTVPIKVIK